MSPFLVRPATSRSVSSGDVPLLPAHFCSATGFKPTYGHVSRTNAMPLSFTLNTVGPLVLSTEDCALIGSVIVGVAKLDAILGNDPDVEVQSLSRPPWSSF